MDQKKNSKIDAQIGDILLFHRARKWNKLITWFTKSPYYHVAIYEGDSHVIEARPRGVVRRDLNGPDGDTCFDVISSPQNRGADALKWAETQIGAGYDRLDVAAIVVERTFKKIHINRTSDSEYSCGEFVTLAFEKAGVHLFPGRDAGEIVPADFAPMLPQQILDKRVNEEM